MAARIEPAQHTPGTELLDLRQLGPAGLKDLLAEEIQAWREELDWDFCKSAELVERFVDLRSLLGYALLHNGEVAGYTYYVFDEHKGLIGDLYLRRRMRTAALESGLLEAALGGLTSAGIRRVEAQLIMADGESRAGTAYLTTFERNFMRLEPRDRLPASRPRRPVHIERWSEHHMDAAARLIAAAYADHVDARINDQYRSAAGARRFLFNIVQYPGCGAFHKGASFAAFEASTGRICGVCLASMVAPWCGHITQICVSPAARGMGIGYELLRHSLDVLADQGCHAVSLTVTASNPNAVALYQSIGFRTVRRFLAYVWEGF